MSDLRQIKAKLREGTEVLRTGGGATLTATECNALLDHFERADEDAHLACWVTPDAIIDAFDLEDEDDERKVWVKAADEETLREIGEECINSDTVWRAFHDSIRTAVEARL